MFDKFDRINVFEDTLNYMNTNEKIRESINNSIINTVLYKDKDNVSISEHFKGEGNIKIINERSFEASRGYENVAVLNFASATNPGGGVKRGSNAQEECLCRCSTLYKCLSTNFLWKNYYEYHRNLEDTLYTDTVVYTKDVLIFKSDTELPYLLPENEWFTVNVLTAPAPNIRREICIEKEDLLNLFKNRIRKILSVSIINGNRNIVLGAFGCGAFKNPPEIVAKAFKEILIDEQYRYEFNNIIFAILTSKDTDTKNIIAFEKEFKGI